jgi:hypothetical protein
LVEAIEAITITDTNAETHVIRLKPDARQLAFGLLGPAPESPDYQRFHENDPPTAAEAEPAKPSRRRGKSR